MFAGLCLVFIAWGMEIPNVWPVLVAHASSVCLLGLALTHSGCLLMIALYDKSAAKGTPARRDLLFSGLLVILTWSQDFVLMGKIGGH